jgi:biotin carboxyl carrier protein
MRTFRVMVNDTAYTVAIEEIGTQSASVAPPVPVQTPVPTGSAAPRQAPKIVPAGDGVVTAQMPGTVIDIMVQPGDTVKTGQKLLILEAMKMANEVVAPTDGTIAEIAVSTGSAVNAGDVLLTIS